MSALRSYAGLRNFSENGFAPRWRSGCAPRAAGLGSAVVAGDRLELLLKLAGTVSCPCELAEPGEFSPELASLLVTTSFPALALVDKPPVAHGFPDCESLVVTACSARLHGQLS